MSRIGGSACKYIKKSKHCITPCTKVHNSRIKHKWYCKQTKKCFDVKKRHKKRKTAKRKSSSSPTSPASPASSSFF
jgi:hypothetical protein